MDADFHMTEQIWNVGPYMNDYWQDLLTGFHERDWYYDPFPDAGIMAPHALAGRTRTHEADTVASREDVYEGIDQLDVDRPLVNPGDALLNLSMVHHDGLAAEIARAYNRFFLEEIACEDFYGTMAIAGQDPARAAEEIDDVAGEDGVHGVYLPTGGLNPPLGDSRYDPIYAACESNDVPLFMHNTADGTMTSFPVQYDGLGRAMPNHAIAHPFQHMVNVSSILTRGVPERFDVDLVFQEGGLGWVPFLMHRLDEEYYAQREDAPLLEKRPSEYMREDFHYTTQPVEGLTNDPEYVCSIARMMNASETLMWSSDYPHHDFDHLVTVLRAFNREFTAEELTAIFGGNARELLES